MRKCIFILSMLLPFFIFGQDTLNLRANSPTRPSASLSGQNNGQSTQQTSSKSDRISFIIGPGASYITKKLFDNPVVNQTNNNVMINDATNIKTNLAVGIIYTPHIWDITRRIRYIDANGLVQTRREIESVPKGRTIAAFVNPIAFTKVTETQPFFNMLDFGVGYGHRFAGGLLIMGTAEFFSVRQPRQWFIDEYKGKNKPYEIGGSPQKTIDINDNSIFTFKPVVTFGFKICYSFDIIKNYINGAQNFTTPTTQQSVGTGRQTDSTSNNIRSPRQ